MKKIVFALGLGLTLTSCASTLKIDDPVRPAHKLPYMATEKSLLNYNVDCEWTSEPENFSYNYAEEHICVLDKWATVTIKLVPNNDKVVLGYGNNPRRLVDKVQIFWKQWPEDLHASRNDKKLMAEAAGYISMKFLPKEASIPFVDMILSKEDKKIQTRYWNIDYHQSESGATPLGIVTMKLRTDAIPPEVYNGVFYNLNSVDVDDIPVKDPSIASDIQPVEPSKANQSNNNQ